jgi:hypothetical protein
MTFYGYGRHKAKGYIAGELEEPRKRRVNSWISFLQSKMPELKAEYRELQSSGSGRRKRGHGKRRRKLPKAVADEIKAQVASGYFY